MENAYLICLNNVLYLFVELNDADADAAAQFYQDRPIFSSEFHYVFELPLFHSKIT